MKNIKIKYETKLLLILSFAAILFLGASQFFTRIEIREDGPQMIEAVSLAQSWFAAVNKMKNEKRISNDIQTSKPYNSLIGDEYTDITTTLGSLEAKEISTNPVFAALIVKYLTDASIDETKTVGIILSGSFPALSISCLAAIQTLNCKAILFSSLGASTYGANQAGATWLDIENHLIEQSNLKYKSSLVTIGAENDNGGGLSDEGIQTLKNTIARYSTNIYYPKNLRESIKTKVDLLLKHKIDILINIGGNQTSFGTCVHSLGIPNGFNKKLESCKDGDRGIIARLAERGIPFINLLNIKRLAIENHISINPAVLSNSLYSNRKTQKIPIAFSIVALSGFLLLLRKKKDL